MRASKDFLMTLDQLGERTQLPLKCSLENKAFVKRKEEYYLHVHVALMYSCCDDFFSRFHLVIHVPDKAEVPKGRDSWAASILLTCRSFCWVVAQQG